MELSSKLKKYLDVNVALHSYKALSKLRDTERKALFYEICKRYDIASPTFEDKGVIRRTNIIHILSNITRKGDEEFGDFYAQLLYHEDGQVFYYAILSYALCLQEKAYSKLLEIVFNNGVAQDKRAYALYELCIISGQRFLNSNVPTDERKWNDSDFPLEVIKLWDKAGRQKGVAYVDSLHEKILSPDENNVIDKLIVGAHKKYYTNAYISARDIIDGKKNIGKPLASDVEKIRKKWSLPQMYKYFIENFVVKNELKREICLYSADNLIERQIGFAVDLNGIKIPQWNQNHVIIADWNGDQCYCIDLTKGNESPIYQFYHDDWKFRKYAESFIDFLQKII